MYLDVFYFSAASDPAAALLPVPYRWEGASVPEQVASHTNTQPIFHGIKFMPSGLLPLSLAILPIRVKMTH